MEKDTLILIILFVIALGFGAFLIFYQPPIKFDGNVTENDIVKVIPFDKTNPSPEPTTNPSGLITEPQPPQQELQLPQEPIQEPIPNSTLPANYSEIMEGYVPSEPITNPEPESLNPPPTLPKTNNPNLICSTMCEFRKTTMQKVETRGNQYFCICQNGYERVIGTV